MQERPEDVRSATSFTSPEQEPAEQRIQELIHEHNVLGEELRHLISEEDGLIRNGVAGETDFVRMEQIGEREMQVLGRQIEIIDEMRHLQRSI